jgi:hypothetical protein
MPSLILLVFAFVLAFIAAFFSAPIEPHRTRLIAASLAFFFAAAIFGNERVSKVIGSRDAADVSALIAAEAAGKIWPDGSAVRK